MTDRAKTVVEYFAEHERYRCGYCGNTDTNYSHGMWAHMMNVQDYQDLLDRGWRRSGKYTYKPTMNMTCCPQYTIRCEVKNFKLRKSHKKVLKKVNKYMIHGVKPKKEEESDELIEEASGSGSTAEQRLTQKSDHEVGQLVEIKPQDETNQAEASERNPDIADNTIDSGGGSYEHFQSLKSPKQPRPGSGQDPSKPPCKKAKELRKERKLAKLSAKGVNTEESIQDTKSSKQTEPKTLEDFINEPSKADNCAHRLQIRLVRSNPESEEFKASLAESHSVYHRYQMSIHGDPPDKPNMKQYKRFLIDSPLEEEHVEGGIPDGYGSFHQQYILDGKIICVGVIDILPSLVSSKYLYYDPDYNFLSLGTYSALQELAFIRNLNKYSEEMKYYYMGFYIHSCPKMKYKYTSFLTFVSHKWVDNRKPEWNEQLEAQKGCYGSTDERITTNSAKGQYFPSYLQCPETYTWHPVEQCAPKLDLQKYCRFADSNTVDANGTIDLSSVLVLFSRQLMTYQIYKALSRGKNEDEDEVKEYANFVGKKCSQSMLLFRK